MPRLFWLRLIYLISITILSLMLLISFAQGNKIHHDLNSLLPQSQQDDPIWQAVQNEQQHKLNKHIVLLIGATNRAVAINQAQHIATSWKQSGLFTQIDAQLTLDFAIINKQIQSLGIAALPVEQAQLLLHNSKEYFRMRAEAAINPFSTNTIPLQQDWLGFGRFILTRQLQMPLQWDSESGFLITQDKQYTWVWLRAHLPDHIHHKALWTLWKESRKHAEQQGATLLASGGALFSADSKIKAEKESLFMSAIGSTLTFLLIALLWRNWKLSAILIPLFTGIMAGLAACLAVFGHIHALTLVIGTSLIGVLIDFPLHWLAASLYPQTWQAQSQMQRIYKTFALSLTITATGYALLFFTPLAILQQTAIFSTAALFTAFASTALLLPPLLQHLPYRPNALSKWIEHLLILLRQSQKLNPNIRSVCLVMIVFLTLIGIAQSRWQDDIRNWSKLDTQLFADTQQIARIAQLPNTGQYLLISAANSDQLLHYHQHIAQQWQSDPPLQTLSMYAMPLHTQQALKTQLASVLEQPHIYSDLIAIGIPEAQIQQALHAAITSPPISLTQSLTPLFAESARQNYLGSIAGQEVSLLPFQASLNNETLQKQIYQLNQELACQQCIRLIDTRQDINTLFTHTRNQAAWLKLLSIIGAWFVLWKLFGGKKGSLMLLIPLSSAAASIAILSYCHIPLGLFPMFGLLLAAAIGLDYSIYALNMSEALPQKCAALCLASATTEISFIILCFSNTQAVAHFGLAVALGIGFNLLLTLLFLIKENPHEHTNS